MMIVRPHCFLLRSLAGRPMCMTLVRNRVVDLFFATE